MSFHDPVWKDLYERLKFDIETGKLPEGTECPSEIELTQRYKDDSSEVSRGTVRRALSELFKDGYLDLRPGKRRVIRKPAPLRYTRLPMNSPDAVRSFGQHLNRIAENERWPEDDRPHDLVIDAPQRAFWYSIREPRLSSKRIKDAFEYSGDEEVIWMLRARYARKNPLVLQWAVIPAQLLPRVPTDSLQPEGLTRLYEKYEIYRDSYTLSYQPTMASTDEARLLRVERGTALIEEVRVSYCMPHGETESRSSRRHNAAAQPYELLITLYTHRLTPEFRLPFAGGREPPAAKRKTSPKSKEKGRQRATPGS